MIKVILDTENKILGPFPFAFLNVIGSLSGAKRWRGSECVIFDDNANNLRLLKEYGCTFEDNSKRLEKLESIKSEGRIQQAAGKAIPAIYKPKMALFKCQRQALELSWDRKVYALFMEMGLGKTAIIISNAGILFKQRKVFGVLVIAPLGVHEQWLEEEVPKHLDGSIKVDSTIWTGGKDPIFKRKKDTLHFFSINIDAVRTSRGFDACATFLRLFNGNTFGCIDESHMIKNWSADRTRACMQLKPMLEYRRISTGTPIAKNLIDAWSQFKFLDEDILGHKYKITFEKQFCIKGGFKGREIVGSKNHTEFYQLIAPYSFRYTKAEDGSLPPKLPPVVRKFDIDEATKKHLDNFRLTLMTAIDDGTIVKASNAASGYIKLMEITSGFMYDDNGNLIWISDYRLKELANILDQIEGRVIIWCAFIPDIDAVAALLKKRKAKFVTYYGATNKKDRGENRRLWREEEVDYFVSNTATGGTGNNLQGNDITMVYYSHTHNSIHRWQSEDRGHRHGMKGFFRIIDMVAKRSTDPRTLGNLRTKKSLSDLSLDEIRLAIASM